RREFLQGSMVLMAASAFSSEASSSGVSTPPAFRLGLVTYNLARAWDVATLIARCKATGFAAVELRTTHAHGVEPDLSPARRKEVRQQFEDAGIVLWGLGTVCEFHSPDPAVVRQNIETCKRFCELARDVGAKGVKVRPNDLPEGIPPEKTLEQIGKALIECGQAGADNGVEIWLEVHGRGTQEPPNIARIMQHCGHPSVGITWNSNATDVKNGSVRESFELLKRYILSCHITELTNSYPWRELFALLKSIGYNRYTLAEIPGMETTSVGDIERFMRYYRALWQELCR
ncbi:MAG: sugar phosphate isomerase/epimerase family protein, partial [Armatimonadota bacterium]|nr:sugar phosphate isomerase/epimerase family protein [Armatimonadota bacterium]